MRFGDAADQKAEGGVAEYIDRQPRPKGESELLSKWQRGDHRPRCLPSWQVVWLAARPWSGSVRTSPQFLYCFLRWPKVVTKPFF